MVLSLLGVLVMTSIQLPVGPAPEPVTYPHFPDALHAYVWRNWPLVPTERLAEVVGAQPQDLLRMGVAMGLGAPPTIPEDQLPRSSTTIIRRNWHLLPYEQLLALLQWTPEEMAYHLREDDFLWIKLGNLKPRCEPILYTPPDEKARKQEEAIARIVRETFPGGIDKVSDPLFGFIARLSEKPAEVPEETPPSGLSPRFCFSYFGLTGDPFLGNSDSMYPEGYLARLAAVGVDGVWLQGVLFTLAPFPWDPKLSERYEERLDNLRGLVAQARKYGIGVYLYLNEPRAMPVRFFEDHPDLKGVVEGDYAALCTSHPEVQAYVREAVAHVCRSVPGLRGFFSISASENLTNCWSHHRGSECSRCGKRAPAEVIAEVNSLFRQGIELAKSKAELIVWDWGWRDDWTEAAINALPLDVALMSVSEWSIPIKRGGIPAVTGEYSLSVIGPGPRAQQHWQWARNRGMKTMAKLQLGTTWELGSVPYIPAVENVAIHLDRLREAELGGLMLGWTLGGYPSPNLEVAAEMGRKMQSGDLPTPKQAMEIVAARRFGQTLAPAVVDAWCAISKAFQEFPYHPGLLYSGPMHMGPADLFWEAPTGYKATMVGLPYDDLDAWRACYPPDVFIGQFEKMADGFEQALVVLRETAGPAPCTAAQRQALAEEMDVAQACAIHFRSSANQARFVRARNVLAEAASSETAGPLLMEIEKALEDEIRLARELHAIQTRDSRIGYEASNQYFFVPLDLVEKALNCRDLIERWLPAVRAAHGI